MSPLQKDTDSTGKTISGSESNVPSEAAKSNARFIPHHPDHVDIGFFKRRIASFAFAFRGLRILIQTQTNARIHLVATVLVAGVGLLFGLTASDWALLMLAMGLVWTTEAVNTAIELTVDLASPEHHELAGKAKDVAAAAVLLSALTAIAIACCVFFGPHGLRLFT